MALFRYERVAISDRMARRHKVAFRLRDQHPRTGCVAIWVGAQIAGVSGVVEGVLGVGGGAGARITSAQIDILSLLINLVQLRCYQKAAYDLLVCHLSAEHAAHPLMLAPTRTHGQSRRCGFRCTHITWTCVNVVISACRVMGK